MWKEYENEVQLGLRSVICIPLREVPYVDRSSSATDTDTNMGVLYLDSREPGMSFPAVRAALETLGAEAAVAIGNARLYRAQTEKATLRC
jgi:GAF domain-containing protein